MLDLRLVSDCSQLLCHTTDPNVIFIKLLNCKLLFINILKDPEEKPKETPATTDDKPIEIKSEESTDTTPVKIENELSVKTDTPEETTVSKNF